MLYLFRSKNYRKASSLLQTLGMLSPDFRGFQVQQISTNLKACESLLPSMLQVMQEIKLSPLKALKITLFCLQIIHSSKDRKVYQLIFEFLRQLQQRVLALVRAKKGVKGTTNTIQVLNSSKEFLDRSTEVVQIDFSSIMLQKIVIPLICFQQKLIACCQLVYDRERTRAINQAQTWSFVNLMRKITDIGPDVQSLGRYYFKESVSSVISLMKVIHFDIQLLYKRIMDYVRKKIAAIQVLLEEHKMKMELIIEKQQLYEFLMMIDELQLINQKLRVLYNGRYFIFHLANAFVYLPLLFTPDQNIDLIYKIKHHHKQCRKDKSLQLQRRSKQRTPIHERVQDI